MARIRSIKPEFWKDGRLARISDPCALFFIGLWNFCDDDGKCRNDSLELSLNMPRFNSQHISRWVQTLFEHGLVQLSTDFGWVSVVSWNHQRIDKPQKPKIQKSEIEWLPIVERDYSKNAQRMVKEDSKNVRRKDRIGKDRIGKDRIGGSIPECKTETVSPPPQNFISIYCDAFKKTYGTNPIIKGKEAGIAKRIAEGLSLERIKSLIEAYFEMRDPWFVTKRHDLVTFEQNMNAVVIYADTGKTISKTQINQMEKQDAVKSQLERIRNGKLT